MQFKRVIESDFPDRVYFKDYVSGRSLVMSAAEACRCVSTCIRNGYLVFRRKNYFVIYYSDGHLYADIFAAAD
jgi:hypothetical protein